MVEDSKESENDMQRAEVFDALGHPTRIAILKALNESSLGFSDLKKKTGLQSNGHLQHHLNKLAGLVKTDEYGKYALSDQGKDALLTVGTVEDAANPAKKRRIKLSAKKVIALLLVAVIVTSSVSVWAFDRIETHRRWVNLSSESFDYGLHMIYVGGLLLPTYYNTSRGTLERFSLDNELGDAFNSLSKLQHLEQGADNLLALGKIHSFMSLLVNDDLNLTQLSSAERNDLRGAILGVGQNVACAYGVIGNYTTMDNSGPPFWYFGPSSPDQAYLQQAVDYAVNGTQIISKN